MLHIAIISLAIGNLALVYGFMWMNRRIRHIELWREDLIRIAQERLMKKDGDQE